MTTVAEAGNWDGALDRLMGRLGSRFCRVEARQRARSYVAGLLLAPLERKNGWHLAEAAGDASPDGVQDFLARMRWDADAVRDDLRTYVVEHLGDPGGVPVKDLVQVAGTRWTIEPSAVIAWSPWPASA